MTDKELMVFRELVDLLLLNRVIDNVTFASTVETAEKICMLFDIEHNTVKKENHYAENNIRCC